MANQRKLKITKSGDVLFADGPYKNKNVQCPLQGQMYDPAPCTALCALFCINEISTEKQCCCYLTSGCNTTIGVL